MAVPKKKTVLKSITGNKRSKSPSSAISSITPDEHLLRQFSLLYFVDKNLSVREVAKKLNTTKKQIETFFEDPEFIDELEERMERVHGVDTQFMQGQAQISLVSLYEEMRRREVEGELKDIAMRDLHKMIVDTQKELRLDTPGAFTSKVGVADLGNLQDRYERSLSGRLHRRDLKNVTPKKKKKELVEGSKSSVEEDHKNQAGGSQ